MDGKSTRRQRSCQTPAEYPEELWGIEDPRITYVPELQQYAVAYTSYSKGGPGVSLALTTDFRTFERFGVIMSPDDKDAALLPHRVDGLWALHSSAHDASWGPYLDLLLSRPAALGRPSSDDGGAQRGLVGRQQDRLVLSANRDRKEDG